MQSTEASRPRLAAFVAWGLGLGAASGAVEMALRVQGALEPSVARRSLELTTYAAVLYGSAGALLASILFALVAAATRVRARSRAHRPHPARAGSAGPAGSGRVRRLARAATLVSLAAAFALAAWAERAVEPPLSAQRSPGSARPDVVLIVIDTLRADALGCYGGTTSTPSLDLLAERGALFEHVLSPTSWTLPAVATLFTATPPWRHGVTDYDRFLPDDLAGLPEVFGAAGYACVGVVGNPLMTRLRGFDRGFDFYDVYAHELEAQLVLGRAFARALRAAGLVAHARRRTIPWLEPRFPFVATRLTLYTRDEDLNRRLFEHAPLADGRPLFLYVHYTNPHTPYLEHPFLRLPGPDVPDPTDPEGERRRYAGEVAYTDGVVGELFRELEERGRLANAYVLVTSDHGEEFGEHGGWEHGHGLYREVVRVPWILAGPGVPQGLRVEHRVQLLDVGPTLLRLAGLDVPASFAGRSVLEPERDPRPLDPSYLELTSRFLEPHARHFGLVSDRYKVVRKRAPDGTLTAEEVYDLLLDPEERTPLATVPAAARLLFPALDELEARPRTRAKAEPADLEAMRALGYAGAEPDR